MDATDLGLDTRLTLLVAGVVFFWALVLGVVKYVQILRSPEGHAHPYTDIAHRAALMYSFATLLIAVFVELSAFPQGVDLTAVVVLEVFFIASIGSYMLHGLRKDTTNQLVDPPPLIRAFMVALIVGELGAFGVLLIGFTIAAF